eukprot:346353-Amphidinium_carterae.1
MSGVFNWIDFFVFPFLHATGTCPDTWINCWRSIRRMSPTCCIRRQLALACVFANLKSSQTCGVLHFHDPWKFRVPPCAASVEQSTPQTQGVHNSFVDAMVFLCTDYSRTHTHTHTKASEQKQL